MSESVLIRLVNLINWRSRWLVGSVLLLMMALVVYAESPLIWNIVTFSATMMAAYEWGCLSGFRRLDCFFYVLLFCLFAAISYFFIVRDVADQNMLWGGIICFWALIVPWLLLSQYALSAIFSGVLGMLLLYTAWQAGSRLYALDITLLVGGLGAVFLFDIAAFIGGRLVGKTPLAPTISPKKTVEGFVVGATAVMIAGTVYASYYVNDGRSLTVTLAVVFVIAVFALLGDLFESVMKRQMGLKDSGRCLGDHGGILDRFDAILPVLPFLALLSPWLN